MPSSDTSVLMVGFSFSSAKSAALFCTVGMLKTMKSMILNNMILKTMIASIRATFATKLNEKKQVNDHYYSTMQYYKKRSKGLDAASILTKK